MKLVLWVAVLAQLIGGVGAFVFAPDAVFADIGSDPLARTTLRLGAWSNLSAAIVGIQLLRNGVLLRTLAAAHACYHALSGLEASWALGSETVRLASPVFGPAVFHGTMALVLLIALAQSGRTTTSSLER